MNKLKLGAIIAVVAGFTTACSILGPVERVTVERGMVAVDDTTWTTAVSIKGFDHTRWLANPEDLKGRTPQTNFNVIIEDKSVVDVYDEASVVSYVQSISNGWEVIAVQQCRDNFIDAGLDGIVGTIDDNIEKVCRW